MSHLACADEASSAMNGRQRQLVTDVSEPFRPVPRSLSNSAGIRLGPEYHFDMVRPGIALYGGASHPDARSETVVTAEARILQVHSAEAGETVGYGASRKLNRRSRIAVVGAGYADGYPRAASGGDGRRGGQAWLDGYLAPILGRVSMDLIALDVTDFPDWQARAGMWVELFGPNLSIDLAAEAAGTIGYELLTGLSRRAERDYLR
jgi:alanine racemase